MNLLYWGKDGGKESTVWGFWLVEMKSLFSVALLKFVGNSREAFHTHAFNSISWVLKGELLENFRDGKGHPYLPSLKPVITTRDTFHKVDSVGTTWVLTFRGPWAKTWSEWLPAEKRYTTLTHGRKEV
jgi:hypothetical protein